MPQDMRLRLTLIQKVALSAAGFVVTVAIGSPVGQFFIALADERGWYQNPSRRLAAMMDVMAAIADSSWFHWIGGAVVGLAIGLWLDRLLRKRERQAESSSRRLTLTFEKRHPWVQSPASRPTPNWTIRIGVKAERHTEGVIAKFTNILQKKQNGFYADIDEGLRFVCPWAAGSQSFEPKTLLPNVTEYLVPFFVQDNGRRLQLFTNDSINDLNTLWECLPHGEYRFEITVSAADGLYAKGVLQLGWSGSVDSMEAALTTS